MTQEENNQEWLIYLISNNKFDEIKQFLENNNLNLNFYYPMRIDNPLVAAIKQNNLEIFDLLIAKGGDSHILMTQNNYNLITSLPFFARDVSEEILNRLVELGVKPYQDDIDEKNSALSFALMQGNVHLAKKLLNIGSNINEIDKQNTPIIYKVIERRLFSTIEFILGLNPDLSFIDYEDKNLIEHALNKGEVEVAKKLFDFGADSNINIKKIAKQHMDKYTVFQAYIEKQMLEKNIPLSHNAKIKQKI